MLDTTIVGFIRRISATALVLSLSTLLSACMNTSSPDTKEPRNWVIENVAGKSTAELYADLIAPGVYKQSSSKEIDGYTVESGNLKMPDESTGSLVAVRSKDGSLTAIVEKPGESGLLVINSNGETRFTPSPTLDYSLPDTVKDNTTTKAGATNPSVMQGPYVIDMLIGYSRDAVSSVGGNAHANALAQIESVNLALRNSLITNISIELVGIEIVEKNYPVNLETYQALPQIFSTGIATHKPDLVYGMFNYEDSGAGGYGELAGRFAMGLAWGAAVFRHEVGHNAGGLHCVAQGGAPVPYGYGHNNGKTTTAQCGNANPYYSTPAVRDAHGLLIGDAATADMARVWRENAQRLSSYTARTPKNFRLTGSTAFTATFSWDPSPDAVGYNIYYTSPTTQNPVKAGSTANPTYTASVMSNRTMYYAKAVGSLGIESELSNGATK
ncbi:hypothetical protein HFK74_25080|uniref:M12 family metallo-peptidase n=1 Tax=Pseudomonas sp. SbOxS1 TaxID=2723884 RepID=UPI0015D38573|nr:M12 family metallo-peptidase [Pseudomonas sp. SbOxS1]NYU05978.1 hypothetical protein [Pseudomonas sp. SbOxS1]